MDLSERANENTELTGEMQVEDRIVKAHNKLSESVKQCRKTYFIWDSNIFLSFVKEIKYFASLNLITEDDVAHLKDELYQLLSVMETLSVKGEFSEGRKSLSISQTLISKRLTPT